MDTLRWLQMVRGPPLSCCLLMLMMTSGALLTTRSQLELHLETLHKIWDGRRLLTYVLCASEVSLFLISVLLLLLFGGKLEEHLGTLCYLQLSIMCTLCCATLYLVVSCLLPATTSPATGYLGTQLALLMVHRPTLPWGLGKKITFLLPCSILIITYILCPESSLLLHVCGVITGLVFRSVLLSVLERFKPWRLKMEKTKLCHILKSNGLAQFVPSGNRRAVPSDTDEREERLPFSYQDVSQSANLMDVPCAIGGIHPHAAVFAAYRDTPPSILFEDPEQLENEMLKAGIQASLRDYEQHETRMREPTLPKSSVSALRLQQLERMGFPTGPAVVALAATGKVDRAVTLLVEGQVGEDIKVTNQRKEDL
ncbi:rhomboid domain-containing protein 3 [Pelodytes ibericus]